MLSLFLGATQQRLGHRMDIQAGGAAPATVCTPVSASAEATGRPPERRRLIFVNRYFYPDVSATSQMLSDLVDSFGERQFEIHVICSNQLYTDAGVRLPSQERLRCATVHRSWSSRFGRDRLAGRACDYLSFLLSATLAMLRWARRGDVIVAMTDPPMTSVCAALVARLKGARLINWLQDIFPEVALRLGTPRLPAAIVRPMIRARNWSLRAAEKNVVLGASMQRVITELRVPRRRQCVIENWADAQRLSPRARGDSVLRTSLGAQQRFVVQYSGNMGRAHEFETLLGAALELRDEPVWMFLFVGGGSNMQRLRSEADRERLTNVYFLPHQPRESLADCLAAADVHICSLRPAMEGLIVPSKLYGILAVGRPVILIGDPDGEQARVVRGADCGRVITTGDSAGLVDELRRMRSAPDWLRDAGSSARQLFERRYTLNTAVGKWRAILDALSGQGFKPADAERADVAPVACNRS